jgi:hypothetical protein
MVYVIRTAYLEILGQRTSTYLFQDDENVCTHVLRETESSSIDIDPESVHMHEFHATKLIDDP